VAKWIHAPSAETNAAIKIPQLRTALDERVISPDDTGYNGVRSVHFIKKTVESGCSDKKWSRALWRDPGKQRETAKAYPETLAPPPGLAGVIFDIAA
jgi:hypothetical protein